MSDFSWRWRTKPRSAIRVVQWFPEFAKLEGKNWNEELLEKFSTYEKIRFIQSEEFIHIMLT